MGGSAQGPWCLQRSGGPGLRVHLTVGAQPSLPSGFGSRVAAPALASGRDAETGEEGPPGQRGALHPPLTPSPLHKSGKLGNPAFLLPRNIQPLGKLCTSTFGKPFRVTLLVSGSQWFLCTRGHAPHPTRVNLVKLSSVPGGCQEFRQLEEAECWVWNLYWGILCT